MFEQIRKFFDANFAPGSTAAGSDPEHARRLAVAALLLEMSHTDYDASAEELDTVRALVRDQFGLAPQECESLLALAESERDHATDYFQFTQLINHSFSREEKIALIESLWRVAFADGRLDKYEEHMVRKLAELIHLPHTAFIAAKHRVADNLPHTP